MREYQSRVIPTIHGDGVLGKNVEDASSTSLDTFDLEDAVTQITYQSDEVTALCPVTGQPDWYTVTITLLKEAMNVMDGIESKSLKLYLQSFRNKGLFAEAFVAEIARRVKAATNAGTVIVAVKQKSRGGVTIEAEAVA